MKYVFVGGWLLFMMLAITSKTDKDSIEFCSIALGFLISNVLYRINQINKEP